VAGLVESNKIPQTPGPFLVIAILIYPFSPQSGPHEFLTIAYSTPFSVP